MNPSYENYEEYIKYRSIIKKVKSIETLDGLDINDNSGLDLYKNKSKMKGQSNEPTYYIQEKEGQKMDLDENDLNNIIMNKKRQSTITYSQRMLKKADNLTKFNRKNHSEGNKHITNNDL